MVENQEYTKLMLGVGFMNSTLTPHGRSTIYISKHIWTAGWYWSFGRCGRHESDNDFKKGFLQKPRDVDKVFESTALTNAQWWEVMDLYDKAYALKAAASAYRYGGNLSKSSDKHFIHSMSKAEVINADLCRVLDAAWDIMQRVQWGVDLDHRVNIAIDKIGEK